MTIVELGRRRRETFLKEIRICAENHGGCRTTRLILEACFRIDSTRQIYSFHAAGQRGENNSERARALS